MKKLFLFAAALLAAISFSACSDDDENDLPATPENIAGTWMLVQEKGWGIDYGDKDTFLEKYPIVILIFSQNTPRPSNELNKQQKRIKEKVSGRTLLIECAPRPIMGTLDFTKKRLYLQNESENCNLMII